MLHDTPAARSFMTYLAGAGSQQAWVELGGFTSVNRSVAPDAYPDSVAQAVADELASAKLIRFGAGDTMPASVQQAWWKAMLELVHDPSKLDAVLESLTSAADEAAGSCAGHPIRCRARFAGHDRIVRSDDSGVRTARRAVRFDAARRDRRSSAKHWLGLTSAQRASASTRHYIGMVHLGG